jgi:hypothetical protein
MQSELFPIRSERVRSATWIKAALVAFVLAVPASTAAGASAASHQSSPAYTAHPGTYRDIARFNVTYSGSGSYRSTYHSEPPNPGGKHDTNDAHDSSNQRWALTFAPLTVPGCGRPARSAADPCRLVRGIRGSKGTTVATGRVAHTHRDGLFPAQNRSERCRVRATPPGTRLAAAIRLRYSPSAQTIAITALIPVGEALSSLPGACPGQGDSIDGLFDNYFSPGFSFDARYTPARWFKSQTVAIPMGILHRSASITIPLHQTPAGTPPRNCAVKSPSRCTATGAWTGVLTLRSRRATRTGR